MIRNALSHAANALLMIPAAIFLVAAGPLFAVCMVWCAPAEGLALVKRVAGHGRKTAA